MELLIVRHSAAVEAFPGLDDAGRWLSTKGRKTSRRVGKWLAKNKKHRPVTMWTSPLVRAVQTAEILAAEVGFKGEVIIRPELSPGRDPGDVIQLLAREEPAASGPVLLVGHEPFLTVLVTALAGNIGLHGPIQKSALLSVSWENGAGRFHFILDPAEQKKIKNLEADGATEQTPEPTPSAANP